MKKLSISLILIGIAWIIFAFNFDTSVVTGGQTIGSGEFAVQVPLMRVNNLGLMNEKQNHLIISSLVLLIGVALFIFSNKQSADKNKNDTSHSSLKNRIEDFINIYVENESKIKNNEHLKKLFLRCSEHDKSLNLRELDDAISYIINNANQKDSSRDEQIFDTIKKLADLNKAGAISDEEYFMKKTELLSKL